MKFGTHGILNKWVIGDYLYKDSCYIYSKEPIAEKVCSDILDYIGLPHIKYDLVENTFGFKSNSKLLSRCKIENNIYMVGELIDKILSDEDEIMELLELIDNRDLLNMFVFDALVSNPDRHFNNIHINKNGELIILDNGQALQSMNSFIPSENHWQSQPIKPFHDDQLKEFMDLTNLTIIDSFIFSIDMNKIINIINETVNNNNNNIAEMVLNNYKNILNLTVDNRVDAERFSRILL